MTYKRKEIIGDCTLYLGDCMEVMPLLNKANSILTDPPYELSSAGAGKSHFVMSLNKFDTQGYKDIIEGVDYKRLFVEFERICDPFHSFVFCSNKQISRLMNETEKRGFATTLLVWHKTNAAPFANGVWRGDIEYIVHSRSKGAKFIGNAMEKKKVIEHPAVIDDAHPTVKPLPIIKRLLINCSEENDLILDPFLGSGTTGVACAEMGRKFTGIELDEKYFDIACRRIENAYKQPDLFL